MIYSTATGSDVTITPYNNVTLSDGDRSGTISITILDDTTPELMEEFQIMLTSVTGEDNVGNCTFCKILSKLQIKKLNLFLFLFPFFIFHIYFFSLSDTSTITAPTTGDAVIASSNTISTITISESDDPYGLFQFTTGSLTSTANEGDNVKLT